MYKNAVNQAAMVATGTARMVEQKLKDRGLSTRTHETADAVVAARALWRHLCMVDDEQLERWARLSVGELANLASLEGERKFWPGEAPQGVTFEQDDQRRRGASPEGE